MHKPLSEYSLEELWKLFPIDLRAHQADYVKQYNGEVGELSNILANYIMRINHIGNTAVADLLAKPIVDILLEIKQNTNIDKLIVTLSQNEWLLMSKETQLLKLSFNKGYTPKGFADKVFHLHVRHSGNWGELYFRDYLIKYPNVAKDYAQLKYQLMGKYKYDRNAYTKAKTDFIEKYTSTQITLKHWIQFQ